MSSQVTTEGLTRQVARWVADVQYEKLPEQTRLVVMSQILDTLGCGLHGLTTEWARLVLRWAHEGRISGAGAASVWGEFEPSLRPADAALVNGTAVHSFELDDYHNVKLHPGAAVIPAALALAERLGAPGREVVAAVAAGYEVIIRTAAALEPSTARLRGWHMTGVCGALGAAAACASLLHLDAEQTAWALGLGGTQGAGLFCFTADGAMSKRIHPGKAAHAGVMAAELAAAGFTGPTQIYEAEDGGFLRAHSDAPQPNRLVEGLGEVYMLNDTSVKPYSCCGSLHAYLDAARQLRERLGHEWDPNRPVRVGLSRVVDVQCGYEYTPSTTLNAQMSLRYCVAVTLMQGNALPAQFSNEAIADPETTRLAQALELVSDPKLDELYPAHFAGWVAARDDTGEWITVNVLDPSGSTAHPLGPTGIARKFDGLVAGIVEPEQGEAIKQAVFALGEAPVSDLMAVLALNR